MATEEKVKHTPGPWSLETVPTQIGICHKIGPFPGSCGRKVGHACIYVDGAQAHKPQLGHDGELLANAHLIAAAPDLLADCKRAVKMFDDLANTLDKWARESLAGGWSTHQVDANLSEAINCRRLAGRIRQTIAKATT